MTAVIARSNILLYRLAMAVVMHVRPDKINQPHLHQTFGGMFHILAVITCQTKQIHLKQSAAPVKLHVTLTLPKIIGISFRVSQHWLETLELQLKQCLVYIPGLLHVRIFHKQIIIGQRPYHPPFKLRQEKAIQPVLRRIIKLDINPRFGNSSRKSRKRPDNILRLVLERILCDMRRTKNLPHTPLLLMPYKISRRNGITLPVINPWGEMTMHVSVKKQLRNLFWLLLEKIKHNQ